MSNQSKLYAVVGKEGWIDPASVFYERERVEESFANSLEGGTIAEVRLITLEDQKALMRRIEELELKLSLALIECLNASNLYYAFHVDIGRQLEKILGKCYD